MASPDLAVRIGAMTMENPVMIASGIFGYGEEFRGLAPYGELGALVLKTVTREPRRGNPPACRTVETPAGMVNAIGLENVGVEAFVRDKLPAPLEYGTNIVASLAGETAADFAACAEVLEGTPVAALELNISCPNVKSGGMAFGVDPQASAEVVATVKAVTRKPVIAKLTPNVTDIAAVARACEAAGADAVSLTNTFAAMVIDAERRCPILASNTGGLSGPAIRPAAVYRVFQVAQAVQVPVIGMGGIWNASDALEFLLAGATAVAVGTALYADPAAGHRILAGIVDYLRRHEVPRVQDLVGAVQLRGLG
jgi:dihydroorotate dehydrogenase (NAD+) catalytic subunit